MKTYSFVLTLALLHPLEAVAQGTFRNMDFEQAQIDQNQPRGIVSADLAFPFWTVYYGSTPQSQVHWNETSAGSTWATLLGQFAQDPIFGGPKSLDGGYSAYLFGGLGGPVDPLDCSIGQIGQLPTDAVSLLFKAQFGGAQQLTVSVGGVSLPIFTVANGPNYTLYGVNVSQYAGMQEELRITAPGFSSAGPNYWNIDDIVFSTTAVPEPTTASVWVFGGGVLGVLVLRRRR